MTVLNKAVLIDYTKLKSLIEQGTVDNDTVYFLSGKDIHDKINDIDTKIESKADQTSIPDISGFATKQEVTNAVSSIQVPSIEGFAKTTEVDTKLEAYAKKTELQHLTAGEGITISETGIISSSAPQVDLSDYVKDESLSLDGLDLVAKYEAAKIKYESPAAENTNPTEGH
jgi:hypothetical protein